MCEITDKLLYAGALNDKKSINSLATSFISLFIHFKSAKIPQCIEK